MQIRIPESLGITGVTRIRITALTLIELHLPSVTQLHHHAAIALIGYAGLMGRYQIWYLRPDLLGHSRRSKTGGKGQLFETIVVRQW